LHGLLEWDQKTPVEATPILSLVAEEIENGFKRTADRRGTDGREGTHP
jgi:hypothetical protein